MVSAAEKQRLYRARRNADPERRAAYLQKHRETWHEKKVQGKVKTVKDLSEREKRRKRAYCRKAQRQSRVRKEVMESQVTPPDGPEVAPQPETSSHPEHVESLFEIRLQETGVSIEDNIDFFMPQNVPENHISDTVVLGEPWMQGGPSRAVASLPVCLSLRETTPPGGSTSQEAVEETRVFARSLLPQGWVFGPYRGEMAQGQLTCFKYAWVVKAGDAYYNIDASDENKSNWMRFVACATSEEEHNMNVFQWEQQIYYRVTKPITQGDELKVCIGKDYAALLLGLGLGESTKCEYGDKEILLGLFQDIQVVPVGGSTLSDPVGSHSWSDGSQTGSPALPLISDVSASSQAEMSALSINSQLDRQEVYDFVDGAEKLLNHPHAAQVRIWFFFGFKVDPSGNGLPLDKTRVVCKLCGESVSLNGKMTDMQHHLIHNHHMQRQNIIGNRSRLLTVTSTTIQRHPPLPGQVPLAPLPSTPQNINNSNNIGDENWTSSTLCPETPASRPDSTHPHISATQTSNAIADFLIRDLLPPNTVEGEGFRQLIRTLLPSTRELPSAWELEGILTELHDRGRDTWDQLLTTNAGSAEEKAYEPANTSHPTTSNPRILLGGKAFAVGAAEVRVPHRVTLSADVWGRDWQGEREIYITLWAHFIDADFRPHNMALGTQRLGETEPGDGDLKAVEAEVRAMALEWGVSEPCIVVIGGEESEKMKLTEKERRGEKEVGRAPHPNSTTFLEREDSVSGDELSGLEQNKTSVVDLPLIPCFLTVVEGCIQKVMWHPVISRTLGLFQGLLSDLFYPQDKNRAPSHPSPTQKLFTALGQRDLAKLRSWAQAKLEWSRLYGALKTLLLHQVVVSDVIKDMCRETHAGKDVTSTNGSVTATNQSTDTCDADLIVYPSASVAATVLPQQSDWKVLEDLCLALKPLDVACRTITKETYSRLSLIKPVLIGLLSRHLALRPGVSPLLKEVKTMISEILQGSYDYPAANRVLSVASALDPQFHGLRFMKLEDQTAAFDWLKKEAVWMEEDRRRGQPGEDRRRGQPEDVRRRRQPEDDRRRGQPELAANTSRRQKRSSSPLSPWEMDGEEPRRSKRLKEGTPIDFKHLRDDDEEVISEPSSPGYQEEEEDDDDDDDNFDPMETTEQNAATGMEFLLGDLYGPPQAESKQLSVEECVEVEVSLYRAEKDLALGEKNSLDWWRAKAGLLPLLARVAQAYLAAPAVAGGAARAFLQEGGGAKNRKNVPSEVLNQLLFLHHNRMSTSAPPGQN